MKLFKSYASSFVLGVISSSFLLGSAVSARDPSTPPQHIVELPYSINSNSLPKYWNGTQTGYYNFDYGVTVDAVSPNTQFMFWANHFYFKNRQGSGGQGYTGLQQRAGGERVVIFSLWGATIDPSNTHCKQGEELGAVASCIMPYDWKVGHRYRFRLWEIEDARKPNADEWWGAWVMDTTNNKETFIAKLKVPGRLDWLKAAQSFVEYYGPLPNRCNTPLPYTKATFHPMSVDKNTYKGTPRAELAPASFAACASKFLHKKTCTPSGGCVIETGTTNLP